MRLLIKLISYNTTEVSLNYNYALSSAIYSLLKFGSPEFSEFLHSQGYVSNNRTYKLFTFAIKFESTQLVNNHLKLISPIAYLYVSSPLVDDFIKNFVIGTFENQKLEIYSEFIKSTFKIHQAELLPSPTFNGKTHFKMISPLVLSKRSGLLDSAYYFRYDDDINEINRILNQNLANKYFAIFNKPYEGEGVTLSWDLDYAINALKKNKKLSKKVTITKDLSNKIDVIGIFCPFFIQGEPELIKVGYECGFGEKNSMGFGMVYTAQ